MTVLQLAVAAATYAAAWLLVARILYGRWRKAEHQRTGARWADWQICTYAMLSGLAWPLVLVAAVVRVRPPVTEQDRSQRRTRIEAEARATQQAVAELKAANDELDAELTRSRQEHQ